MGLTSTVPPLATIRMRRGEGPVPWKSFTLTCNGKTEGNGVSECILKSLSSNSFQNREGKRESAKKKETERERVWGERDRERQR